MSTKAAGIPARAALACLFSALCAAGAYISIPLPIGPVPLALTNLFAVLAGLLLGPLWGALSALAYLAVGALGFPVFSGGRGGLAHLAGPTGGYLIGYVVAAFLAGLLARRRGWLGSVLGAVLGFATILALGACGLKLINGIPWGRALAAGLLPFLPGDAVKALLAALICRRLGPFVDSLTGARDVRA
jgi:biotin transport system substrate-specific component